jgi:hypothetical protein
MADFQEISAAIAIANAQASARLQAAATEAKAQVDAAVQSTELIAAANRDVAQVEAGWRNSVATTEADATRYTADANRDAAIQTTQTDADARRDVAHTQGQAAVDTARIDAQGRVDAARAQADATVNSADADRAGRVEAAALAANAQVQSAQLDANAQTQVATTRATADTQVATITTANQVAVANIESTSRTTVATTTGQFSVQAANVEAGARVQSAGIESEASKYGSDKQLAGVNAHETAETGRLNIKLDFAQAIFNEIKPLLDQIVNDTGSFLNPGGAAALRVEPELKTPLGFRAGPSAVSAIAAAAAAWSATPPGLDASQVGYVGRSAPSPLRMMSSVDPPDDGGQGGGGSTGPAVTVTGLPYIATRGVLTPAQLQQQVNQAYARNDSRTQALIRKSQGDLAGRGFSSNSPILEALKVGYITANLRASVEAASTIRLQAAQANVDAVFRGQQARSEQYLAQENVLVEAERNTITRQVGVLNAVANLIGGVL